MNPAPDLVQLTAAPHPFKAANVCVELPEGLTLKEMIEVAQPDPVLHRYCHVEIDGVPVDSSKLHLIRPKAGHLVAVRVVPGGGGKKKEDGGGGKNPLQTVLMIAVTAAAIAVSAFAPYMAPWVTLGLTVALTAASVGIAMAFAPQPLGGNLRAGARPGSRRVDDVRDSPTQFIEGARNSANPWGPVPDVLGRHRMVPPYAAAPFTSTRGGEQFLHMMFAWSPGELAIADYRIGETPLTQFEDVTIQTLNGTASDDEAVFGSIYANDMIEEAFSILLTQVDGGQVRTTATEADEITVDLTFPQGLVRFDPQGNRQPHQITVNVRYRLPGGAFVPPSPIIGTTFPTSWITVEGDHISIRFDGMTTAAVRHGITWSTPSRSQYEVSVARSSADTTSTQIFDQVAWTALRRLKAARPVIFPVPLARTALRLRASDQLSGAVDTFSAVVHRVAPDWNGAAWVRQVTSSPAAMFRHVLQGPSNRRPVPDSQIDLVKLQEWSEFCHENGFDCSMIVDFPTSVRELLSLICGTGRAGLDNVDGKWSVVIDQPRLFPVQHFTPRNSRGFKAEKVFPDRAHAWRVRFADRAHNWRSTERVVYAPGFNASTATKFEQHDFVGVTSWDQAVHLATHQQRALELQPEEWDFEVDFESLVANRGDMVLLTHDVLLVGQASGRIKTLTLGGGGVITGMTMDELVMMGAGLDYGVSIRSSVSSSLQVTAQVVTVPGTHTELTFAAPLGANQVAVGDLFGFGQFGLETVKGQVKRIKRAGDLAARLAVIPYSDVLFDWSLPADFDPGLTPLFDVPAPLIQTVYTGGAALGREPDATLVRVVVEVKPLGRADSRLDAQARPTATGEHYRTAEVVSQPEPSVIVLGGMRIGEDWDIRVRWLAGPLQPGPWAYRSGVRIQGYDDVDPGLSSLQNLTLSAIGGQALLRWDAPTELDSRFGGTVVFRHSRLQVGATWANSTSIGQGTPARNQVANLPLKGGTYLARVINAAGQPGVVASVSTKQASMHQLGLLVSFDEHPDWAGTHNGTEVGVGSDLQLTGDFVPVGGFGDLGAVSVSGIYDFAVVVDLEAVKRVRVTVHLDATSVAVGDTIDDRLAPIELVGGFRRWPGPGGGRRPGVGADHRRRPRPGGLGVGVDRRY